MAVSAELSFQIAPARLCKFTIDGYGFAVIKVGLRGQFTCVWSRGGQRQVIPIIRSCQREVPCAFSRVPWPDGVDTVVLQEDVNTDGQQIAFRGPLKIGKIPALPVKTYKMVNSFLIKGIGFVLPILRFWPLLACRMSLFLRPYALVCFRRGMSFWNPVGLRKRGIFSMRTGRCYCRRWPALGFTV